MAKPDWWSKKKPAEKRALLLKGRGRGERDLLDAARLAGLLPVAQHPVGPYFADLAFREHNIVIEIDGKSHRDTKEQDAKRDAYFAERGWEVYRVASDVANESPMAVIIAVFGTAALEAQAAELLRLARETAPARLLPSHRPVPAPKPKVERDLPSWIPVTSDAAAEASKNKRKKLKDAEYRALMKKIDRHQKALRRSRGKAEAPTEPEVRRFVAADEDPGVASVGATMDSFVNR